MRAPYLPHRYRIPSDLLLPLATGFLQFHLFAARGAYESARVPIGFLFCFFSSMLVALSVCETRNAPQFTVHRFRHGKL